MGAAALLDIRALSKRFGGVEAVRDCSFAIRRGSITGLIGPNGAGKTTLFNMVAGALPPTTGTVLYQGIDVTGVPAHRLFHRGIVRTFQIPREFARLTCLENLMLVPGRQAGENLLRAWLRPGLVAAEEGRHRDRAKGVLDFLGLAHLRDERAANLSGGQKKLLELGRTMMTNAKLVLLDEPGAGVNRTLLNEIASMIRRLNVERGYTFCLIEHDMGFIADLCDPVVCMAEGTVLKSGRMDEVRQDPRVLEAYLGRSGGAGA